MKRHTKRVIEKHVSNMDNAMAVAKVELKIIAQDNIDREDTAAVFHAMAMVSDAFAKLNDRLAVIVDAIEDGRR